MLGENRSGRAIVLVDLTNEFAHPDGSGFVPQALDIIPLVQGELQYFRERMRPIFFCNTVQAHSGSFGEVIRELRPRTGEICIEKKYPDAFLHTDLFSILAKLKVKNLTIVGLSAPTSILLTAASALQHGYSVVVPETCVCSPLEHEAEHAAALRLIALWSNQKLLKAK